MSKSSSGSGGIGIVSLLGIIFIVLKLTNLIAWKWVWVLLPFWGGAILGFLIIVGIILIAAASK